MKTAVQRAVDSVCDLHLLRLHVLKRELRYDGAKLSTRRAEPMACRAVARGEGFSRDDKGGRVGPKVLEETGQNK